MAGKSRSKCEDGVDLKNCCGAKVTHGNEATVQVRHIGFVPGFQIKADARAEEEHLNASSS